jgi:putative CocE/NonD family hydrolase
MTSTASGTSHSLNDLGLSLTKPTAEGTARWAYPGATTASFDEPRQPGGDQPPSNGTDTGDAATFTSSPLGAALHVAGPVTVSFDAQSTATETDFVVRLLDVAPDGSARTVTEGWLKSSFRALDRARTLYDSAGDVIRPFHVHTTAEPLTPLATEHYEVELLATANAFPAGHRLRIVVTSTAAPWSLQTIAPAVNTAIFGGTHLSGLLLPVVS